MTKNKVTSIVAIIVAVILALSAVMVALFYGSITVVESDDTKSFTITASAVGSMSIVYFNIVSATFTLYIPDGEKVSGLSNVKLNAGEYYNSTYGNYYLFENKFCYAYIVLEMQDGYVVFNCATEEKTEEMYDLLIARNPYLYTV